MKKTFGYIMGYLNLGYLLGAIGLITCVDLLFLNYGVNNIVFNWAEIGLIGIAALAFLISFITYILAMIFNKQKALKVIISIIFVVAIVGVAFTSIWYFYPEIITSII